MAVELDIDDDLISLRPNLSEEEAEIMVEDALALAALVAPCILTTEDEGVIAAAKAIIRGAILRWVDAGTGAAATLVAGPYQIQPATGQARKSLFSSSEKSDLRSLCATGGGNGGAYMIDMIPEEGS